MRIAPISSMTASANSNTRACGGARLPSKVNAPKAKAMSVAVGIAHPRRSDESAIARKMRAGTIIPPRAAINGTVAARTLANEPRSSRPI